MTMTVCHIMSQVPIVWLTVATMIMISMREKERRKEKESKQRRSSKLSLICHPNLWEKLTRMA